ncbi:MAG: carbohydrate kinase family protein [Solobacterium sp.]|nr:carbohydrate kinase family protein [Solobacterium sp.]
MGIAVFGAVFVDIKGYPLAQYISNGRNVGNVIQVHGGVSRNIAEDLGNIQLSPYFVSVVDKSGTGEDIINRLQEHGVDTSYIARDADALGTWLAIFDNNGDVVASISKRPDISGILQILEEKGDELISRCDSIALEIDIEEPILDKIFELAEKYDKKVYAAVSNMSIAMERREFLPKLGCLVCNLQEAGLLFSAELDRLNQDDLILTISRMVRQARIPKMVVTLGVEGCIYSSTEGSGYYPSYDVEVLDTTGAGDSFFAGVCAGLTYGKSLWEACEIGTRIASSVIVTKESTCPVFMPEEFGISLHE